MNITPLKPFGLIVSAGHKNESILDIEKEEITDLLNRHALIVFREYALLPDQDYTRFAKQFGPLLAWEFGEILELKIQPHPVNHIFSSGRVELHWDGAFVKDRPHYNLFQCLRGTDENAGGQTLFVNTVNVRQNAEPSQQEAWQNITIEYSTEKKAHYGGTIREPLCATSPYNNKPVIRYIEAFNEDNAKINPMAVKVDNYTPEESDRFLKQLTRRLYCDDVMYRHTWRDGDFLIADNSCLLHGRSRFSNNRVNRHIKRINIL
jgi:alpha-ketoglutarate-dependent taurine dioxygenase